MTPFWNFATNMVGLGLSMLYLFALHLAHAAEAIVIGAMGGGVHQRGKRTQGKKGLSFKGD